MKSTQPSLSLRRIALLYDDLPAFHAAYVMLTLIFAGIFNLGFFAVLIGLHVLLDFYKYRFVLRKKHINALVAVFRENLADVAFLLLGLSATVYLSTSLPVIGVMTGWRRTHLVVMRAFAVLLPKLSILHHSLRIVFNIREYLHTPHQRLRMGWSFVECVYLSTLLLSAGFLIFAPRILHITAEQLVELLSKQMFSWMF